jgi:hypothetical protein
MRRVSSETITSDDNPSGRGSSIGWYLGSVFGLYNDIVQIPHLNRVGRKASSGFGNLSDNSFPAIRHIKFFRTATVGFGYRQDQNGL